MIGAGPGPADATPSLALPSDDVREVKVKLPVSQVLRLHHARMTRRKNFSEIVSSALTRYFDSMMER